MSSPFVGQTVFAAPSIGTLSGTLSGTRSLASAATIGTISGGATGVLTKPPRRNVSALAPNRFPEHPTGETKLRLVFEELDLNDNNIVEPEGFRRVLKALNFRLSAATVNDLYERMDLNKNSSVNNSEYLNWAQHYPVLIDAIYTRSREAVEHARKETNIEMLRANLEDVTRKERLSNQQYQACLGELKAQERAIDVLAQEHEARKDGEKNFGKMLFDAEKEAEYAKTERNAREKDVQAAREDERKAQKPLTDARREVSVGEQQISVYESEISKSRQKERELEQMLNEAKRETQRYVDALGDANDEVARLRDREREMSESFQSIQQASKRTQDLLREAEVEVGRRLELVNECLKKQRAAREATASADARLEEERRKLPPFKQREGHQRQMYDAAIRGMEDADKELRNAEQELAEYLSRRASIEEDEHPLLEHEIRLREQRYNLDDRDDTHWDEATRFIAVTGRTDTRAGVVAQSPARAR